APSALADDHFLVRVSERELVLGHVRVLPHAAALSFLALIDQPVVVALVDDMAFRRVHGGRADAPVELVPERDLLLANRRGLHVLPVAGFLALLARPRGDA